LLAMLWWQPGKSGQAEGPRGGDFVLRDVAGPVALADFRGKVVLLYFGYTFCPDICPTSLALMSQALGKMTPDELKRVQGLFVSVDPERDTPERLATYAGYFHPNIRGITGTPQEVAKVAAQYGAAYRKVGDTSNPNYVVDHSSFTVLIGPDGKVRRVLPHGLAADKIVDAVREVLAER